MCGELDSFIFEEFDCSCRKQPLQKIRRNLLSTTAWRKRLLLSRALTHRSLMQTGQQVPSDCVRVSKCGLWSINILYDLLSGIRGKFLSGFVGWLSLHLVCLFPPRPESALSVSLCLLIILGSLVVSRLALLERKYRASAIARGSVVETQLLTSCCKCCSLFPVVEVKGKRSSFAMN
mgnify:CR=1 FL=1